MQVLVYGADTLLMVSGGEDFKFHNLSPTDATDQIWSK